MQAKETVENRQYAMLAIRIAQHLFELEIDDDRISPEGDQAKAAINIAAGAIAQTEPPAPLWKITQMLKGITGKLDELPNCGDHPGIPLIRDAMSIAVKLMND